MPHQYKQFDKKLGALICIKRFAKPKNGWIATIRSLIGMSQTQLAKKLGQSRGGVNSAEAREANGSITLSSLQKMAEALDCEFFYVFMPRQGSIEEMLKKRAHEIARNAVMSSLQHMTLEDQAAKDDIETQIEILADDLLHQNLKRLWDESI